MANEDDLLARDATDGHEDAILAEPAVGGGGAVSPFLLPLLLSGCTGENAINEESPEQRIAEQAETPLGFQPEAYLTAETLTDLEQLQPHQYRYDIDRLISDIPEEDLKKIIQAVFYRTADEEIRRTTSDNQQWYKKNRSVPTEALLEPNSSSAIRISPGGEGVYKCAHFVHNVATKSAIQNPTEYQVLGTSRVLRTVHLSDILFVRDTSRMQLNKSSVTQRHHSWEIKDIQEIEKLIDVVYKLKHNDPLPDSSELEHIMKPILEGIADGDIYAMVWSPKPTGDRSKQSGHLMFILRPLVVDILGSEVDPGKPIYLDQAFTFTDRVYTHEAGAAVRHRFQRSIYGPVYKNGLERRDVAIFRFKLDLALINRRYRQDEQFRGYFAVELIRHFHTDVAAPAKDYDPKVFR